MSTAIDPLAAQTFDDVQKAHIRRNARNTFWIIAAIVLSTWILVTAQWWWGAYGEKARETRINAIPFESARTLAKDEEAKPSDRIAAMLRLRQQAVGAVQALQYLSADDSTRVRERADLLLSQIRKVQ